MATTTYKIISNMEDLRQTTGRDAYSKLVDETREEYEDNMLERMSDNTASKDEIEDEIEECRYCEVNMLDNTEYEALKAVAEDRSPIEAAKLVVKMTKAVIEYYDEHDFDIKVKDLADIGKLYSVWRYVVTSDVEWTIEEVKKDE
jgi:hypothetical protein